MFGFSDIIGQDSVKERLRENVRNGRTPHALLFTGPSGCGKLPMALALARYLCCEHPDEIEACGTCPSCIQMNRLVHPDVHFVFPIVKKKAGRDSVCDDFLPQWREALMKNAYLTPDEWMRVLGSDNLQPQIYVRESDEIQRKLSLKSSRGGWKVMIIWLPEKMNAECANKLLKLLEEPPQRTLFLLVSEEPDLLLSTIVSRTQRISLPPLEEKPLADWLERKFMLHPEDAADIAHRSEGSLTKAMENISLGDEQRMYFESFVSLMRLAYKRDIRQLKAWSEQVSSLGRERQKGLLVYCQRMIRENFMFNFHASDLSYLSPDERQFATRFSPYINEKNVMPVMELLEEAQLHVGQNVNSKMVFFDVALRMIALLIR